LEQEQKFNKAGSDKVREKSLAYKPLDLKNAHWFSWLSLIID